MLFIGISLYHYLVAVYYISFIVKGQMVKLIIRFILLQSHAQILRLDIVP